MIVGEDEKEEEEEEEEEEERKIVFFATLASIHGCCWRIEFSNEYKRFSYLKKFGNDGESFDIVGRCVRNAFVNHSSKKKKNNMLKKKTEMYIYVNPVSTLLSFFF